MEQQDNISKLHGLLGKAGYNDIGTEDQFRSWVSNVDNAKKLHGLLGKAGYDDIGTEDAFIGWLGVNKQQESPFPKDPLGLEQMQKDNLRDRSVFEDARYKAEKNKPQVQQPEVKPAAVQQPKPAQQGKGGLTWQEQMAMSMGTQQMVGQVKAGNERIDSTINNTKNMSPVGNGLTPVGMNKNLRTEKKFNAEKGQFEDVYKTTSGQTFSADRAFDAEQQQKYEDYQNERGRYIETMEGLGLGDMLEEGNKDVEARLEDAYAEKERLQKLIKEGRYGQMGRMARAALPAGTSSFSKEDIDNAKEYDNLLAAMRMLDRRITALQAERDDAGFLQGTGDVLTDPSTYSMGLTDASDALAMANIKKKIDAAKGGKPNFTEGEKMLVRNYLMNQDAQQLNENRGWLYNFGQGFGQTLSFMADFALTGGGFGNLAKGGLKMGAKMGAKALATDVAQYMTKNLGTKSAKILEKSVMFGSKTAGMALGAEVGGAALAGTIQAPKTLANIAERHMGNLTVSKDGTFEFKGGESEAKAAILGFLDASGANASELVGPGIDAVAGKIAKYAVGKYGTKIAESAAGKFVKGFTDNKVWKSGEKTLGFLGINSVFGEGMEEEYDMMRTSILNAITNNEFNPNAEGMADLNNQLNTWATVGLTSVILRTPQMIASGKKQATYYGYKYNLNTTDKMMRNTFNDDVRYQSVKDMLDNTENKDFGNALHNIVSNAELTPEEKKAVVMYANDLIALRGFNIGDAVAAANGIHDTPRTDRYNISGNTIEEVDKNGNVLATHEYDSREEMKSALWEMQTKRANDDLQSDISVMKARPNNQFEILVDEYAAEAGVNPEEVENVLNKNPMDRTAVDQQLLAPFAKKLHEAVYDSSMLHEEQSTEDGQDIADTIELEPENMAPEQTQDVADVRARWEGARMAREQLFERNEDIAQEVYRLMAQNLSDQEIISSLSSFREEEVQIVIDYYNQRAKFEGMLNRLNDKIDEEARNRRDRNTFKGTINGNPDQQNIYTITDGENTYTLVSGNITMDADGNITGSDSGMLIGVDANGDFVTIGDSNGYTIANGGSLDEYEEAQRAILQEGVSSVVDPDDSMQAAPAPEEETAETVVLGPETTEEVAANAGGEAGVEDSTGANEPSAPATIPVDDNGLKRYEQGVSVDDAIADLGNDGFDVNEMADAYIAEAQEQIDKINNKKAKLPKDIVERKRLQGVVDYYNQLKARNLELNPPYVDPQPYLDELKNAQSKTKADEILNRAITAGVKAEEIQPAHTQKVQEILAKQEEARRRAEEVTDKDMQDIAEKSGTPEGRAWLLDKKRVSNAEKRRKMAKLIYKELFDDDFEAYRDINELISMWLSKGRTLDPDTFGQELGWDMGIGKDAAKVSTMFAARRENGGDGMLFNDFVHMVAEASDGRYDTQEVRNALIGMFQGAQEKSDLTEYQLTNRVAEAERNLVEAEIRDKEAAEEVKTVEEQPISEGLLPFPPATEEEPFGNAEATEQQEETETPEEPAAEEEHQTEEKPAEEEQPSDDWQYNLHYDKVTGRVWIDREQVGPTGIPIGDGRWHIEAKSLAEMRGILENPANNLGKVYEQVEARLHNEEIGEQLRNESNPMDAIEQTAEQFNEQEKPNNANTEDNSVNVNKTEDNEAENVVSSQEEEAGNGNNAVEMQGDSAEFAEREHHMVLLSMKIFEGLARSVHYGNAEFPTMRQVRSLAHEEKLDDLSLTDLQELVEAQVVGLARKYAHDKELSDGEKFEKIKTLYELQPTLSARDNDRINKQQYSTPAPMAWLMGKFVDPKHEAESGLEPSAGNGMLTIALPKGIMHVNDIDEMRLSNLAQQGFKEVTNQDGTQPFEPKAYDVVVTNPPFGNVAPKMYDGYETTGLEHQMAINALDSMKDDGRAAIIIGGNTEYKDNGSIKGKDRAFLNYLYSHYNVVDVINIDGKAMYAKQGTGYNVRMILINGRKQADGTFAPVQSKARAEQVKSYEELYNRVNDDILSDSNRPASVHDTESGESGRVDDNSNAGESTEEGVRNVRAEGGSGQHSVLPADRQRVSGSSNTSNPGTERSGREVVGGSVSDDRSGTEAAKPSESASVSEEDGNRTESRRDNAERLPAEPSNSERVGQRGTEPTQPTEQPEHKRSLGTEKVPYNKQSQNPFTLQSLMPAEQADVVKKALEELGDTDQFLVDELGYSSKEELHKALAAEQIDSVAMAIHQMNQGNAFIIGDQTGIGKGRQAAALIRYGVKKGGFPVFITVKKGLFSDMYRDLCDIGSPKLRPFIWSADDTQHSANVTDKDGNVIYELPTAKEQKRVVEYINQHGKLPKEYDYVLTTYDSFKSGTMDYENGEKKARNFGKKKPGPVHFNGQAKRDALERLAENSYVIMDESHNAGGEGSNVSGYLQYITTKAKGLTFLSATFAKRPGNMPIYSLKTAISKAGVKIDELIDSVKRGGATFQEIMSKALTEAGQMIRRERDMTGVTIDWRGIEDEAVIAKQREQYDQIIGLFNDIIDFQRTYVDPIVDSLNDDAAESQGEVEHTPGTRDMGINNTPFASRTYNIVQQVLLSLKAEEAAKRAIEHLKMGHKPVITVANTNEGAADEVAGVGGEAMEMPDLSINLRKGLEGTMRISSTDANGNTTKSEIPFDKLSEEGQNRYREIMDAISNASTGLSLSPIDVIKNELKKAGYKVGELTGRKAEFVYNEDGTVKRVNRQDTDKKMVAADFNSGKIDALILNRSAGTGISLHASTKFADQRQRVMIVAQAQGDVNDEVQIRGRIDRTGQVLRGMYEYVVSQIPSEQRLLMMLKAKLRSLDANTTSSQKSKFNEMDVQDIINKYGDKIVVQYLAEHPDTYAKLADPLKWGDTVFTMSPESLVESANMVADAGGTASKILGRMALLKVAAQEQMLDDLSTLYTAEINRLNEMGENDLEITEMPLNAKTLNKQVWEQGVEPGGKNPFADNTYVEKVEMDVLVKPMKGSEVKASQERLLGGKTWDEYKQGVLADVEKWAENKKAEATETYTARATKKATAERDKYVKGATKAKEKNGMSDADIEKNGQYQYDHFYKEEMDKLKGNLADIDKQKQVFVDALETFTTDGVYVLPEDIYDLGGMSFDTRFGKLIDVKIASNCSTAASTLSFATLDGRRKITIPISGMVTQKNGKKQDIKPWIVQHNAQVKSGMMGSNPANTLKVLEQNLDNWDRLTSTATRKEGYIITGNLLKALVETKKQGKGGKLISYTTDTGEVRQGILMSDQFDPSGLTAKTPISTKIGDLRRSGDKVESADKEVVVRVTNDYDWHNRGYNTLSLTVPKSAKKGAKYFNDETLLSLMNGQFEGSGKMKAEFDRANLEAVMKRLDELGVVIAEEHKDESERRYDQDESRKLSVEEGQKRMDELSKQYHTQVPIVVIERNGNIKALLEVFMGKEFVEKNESDEEQMSALASIARQILENFGGGYDPTSKKIVIFADELPEGQYKHAFFHENIHAILDSVDETSRDDLLLNYWIDAPSEVEGVTKKDINVIYANESRERRREEFFAKSLARCMEEGNLDIIDSIVKDSDDIKLLNKILNDIGYDRTRETRRKTKTERRLDEVQRNKLQDYREEAGRKLVRKNEEENNPLLSRRGEGRVSRIVKHIDALVEKLGTKARTTVYHNFDELPEKDQNFIREADKRGKKVRGWYENGHIYLYLPHINSEYQAEKTIWHETVGHHGLRALVGEENVNKLLKQLWLQHHDGEMGKWVSERMATNGWNLNEAIEEYLAREAEKNPFKEPGLWQRLRWMVAELFHKMGFASDPTITDIQYLFWVSKNQLREGDPMAAIRKQSFLHNLDKEAANTPYVNMFAGNVDDIDNPDAEGAYDEGTRYSEETDEEVIERLEKEPKVKVYRAMSLVDGKLYPPMATKQDGKLVNPIELGKWERSDEHPEKAVLKNGKWVFKLTKDNGKSLFAAYNPYIHTSTTMLNDQFSEAQNRDNLVVVECEVPESELTSGYKADKAKDAVGKLEWKAGIIQGQLSGTREVILSRWDKPVRIVPTEEVAQHIADMIKDKVEVMPTNVVTPQQRSELEKLGVKFVETDNRGFINEGENKGKSYSSVYGKKRGRRYDMDIDNPMDASAKALYEDRLNRVETVFTEAYQDSMVSLKTAQNAIAKDNEIPDSQNAYQAENLMHGKNKNEQDLFNQMFRDPLIKAINAILNKTGWNWGDVDRYVYAKSALERNREFFVRDHTTKEKVLNDWYQLKQDLYEDLQDGRIGYYEYLMEQDFFIKTNIDSDYDPNENDYSGLRAMYGDEKGNFNDGDIVADVEDTEAVLGDDVVTDLWEKINAATTYGLERYREAGMRSDEQIDRVERMFNFYVPMRGFKKDTGEDMYQYFTEKGNRKSYVGGMLKHAKGRGSEANYPISTIFAMGYKAIADCNQNLVCQKLYRLCQANPNDLIVLSDSWAKLNPITQEWEDAYPDIDDDMDEEDIRQTVKAFEEQMKIEEAAGNAKKIRGKASFSYKPTDKKKKSEHVVDVRINGDYKRMIVTGNPRMAQALNGQLRFEHGKNVFSNWNAKIKNLMASLFTSYSPTFALRNLFRDWTHFRTMLGVREGHDYAAAANKYYRKSLFKMVGLFKKYREGTLDMNNEMERDFKDFMDNGGVTGFVMMQKVDDIQKDMEKLYKQQKEGKVVKLNNALWDNTIGLIEAVNEGIENNARFATFRASRHFAGRTKARSAYDAKEITVNFNKKGAGSKTKGYKSDSKMVEDAAAIFGVTSQVLGEGRIFFNATVQAIATTFKNFQNPDGSLNYGYISKWTAKYALPPFMFGLLLPYINQMLAAALDGDDNDDDPYANLAEWTRRKNICIYIGNNNFITIPIGQELAAFLTLGDITAGLTYAPDVRPVDRDIKDEMLGVMSTFSPVDIDGKITKGGFTESPISETVGRTFSVAAPLVAVEQNIGWTGRPIYREDKYQNDKDTPEYQMVYQSTNPLLVDALKMLHEMGGGDDIKRGKLEINPAKVQYLWEQYTGGPGKFLANTVSIGKDIKDVIMGNDNNFNIRKVEGVKAFVQQGDDRTEHYRSLAKYRKYREDAITLKHDVDGYKKDKGVNPEHALKYEEIVKSKDYIRMRIILEANKSLEPLYKEANKAEGAKRKELYKKYNELVAKVVEKLDEVGDE